MFAARIRPVGPCLVTLAGSCDDAIVAWDSDGLCCLWNPGAERLLGRTAAESDGRRFPEFFPASERPAIAAAVAATLAGESVPESERAWVRPDGSERTLRVRFATLRDPGGRTAGGVAVLHDLTPRRRAEADRAASESVRRTVFEAALDAILIADDTGRIVDANGAACALAGRPLATLAGATIAELCESPAVVEASWREFLADGRGHGVLRIVRPGGAVRDAEYVARANVQQGRHLAILRDVTDRRAAQSALRASEARFRALFDGIPLPVVVFRWDGLSLRVVEANAAIRREILGEVRGGVLASDVLAARPDLLATLLRCPRERVSVREEVDWTSPVTGRAMRLRSAAHFVAPDLVLAVAEDITAQRALEVQRAELLAAEHAAREAAEEATRRNEALAHRLAGVLESERRRLAGELHDEVGQEITALRMLLEAAHTGTPDSAFAALADGARRAGDLLGIVRDLAHGLRPPVLDDLGLAAAVCGLARRLAEAPGLAVELRHDIEDRRFPPLVEVAAYRIVQEALTNVARHAGTQRAGVRLWVAGEMLFAEVRDDGLGFDEELVLGRTVGSGIRGMRERAGLAGGSVAIVSSPGGGTIVTATLPLSGAGSAG